MYGRFAETNLGRAGIEMHIIHPQTYERPLICAYKLLVIDSDHTRPIAMAL